MIEGKAWTFGDNINTDIISPPQYMELGVAEASRFAMSAVDPAFAGSVRCGDIMVAGSNFGSGSSRETSPLALKHLGVGAILAKFFARIFYRNAINQGLPVLECPDTERIAAGDQLKIDIGKGLVVNLTKGESYLCNPIPPHIQALLDEGGLVPYLKKNLREA